MKTLITKSDGTPTKSKVHALQFLAKQGLDKSCLIEENGQFYYEIAVEQPLQVTEEEVKENTKKLASVISGDLTWETPVIASDNENTKLSFKNDIKIEVVLKAKHPAGQNAMRPYNAVEVKIGTANAVILPLDVAQVLFKVYEPKGV